MLKIEFLQKKDMSGVWINKKDDDFLSFVKNQVQESESNIKVYVMTENDIAKFKEYEGSAIVDCSKIGKIEFYEVLEDRSKGALIESYNLEAKQKNYPYKQNGEFDPTMLDD